MINSDLDLDILIKLIEEINSQKYNLTFTESEMRFIAEIIKSNINNNGMLHIEKMHFYKNRVISIPELYHYTDLSIRYDLDLTSKLRYHDHPIYIKTSATEVLACMFTSQPSSILHGVGRINNIPLTDNVFNYGSPLVKASIIDFYSHIMIFHDINKISNDIILNSENNLSSIILNSASGFTEVLQTTQQNQIETLCFRGGNSNFLIENLSNIDVNLLNEAAFYNSRIRLDSSFRETRVE